MVGAGASFQAFSIVSGVNCMGDFLYSGFSLTYALPWILLPLNLIMHDHESCPFLYSKSLYLKGRGISSVNKCKSYFKSFNDQLVTMIPLLFLGADVFFGDVYGGWWWNEQRVPLYLYAGG